MFVGRYVPITPASLLLEEGQFSAKTLPLSPAEPGSPGGVTPPSPLVIVLIDKPRATSATRPDALQLFGQQCWRSDENPVNSDRCPQAYITYIPHHRRFPATAETRSSPPTHTPGLPELRSCFPSRPYSNPPQGSLLFLVLTLGPSFLSFVRRIPLFFSRWAGHILSHWSCGSSYLRIQACSGVAVVFKFLFSD